MSLPPLVLGLPSKRENLRNMLENSSLKFGLTTFSSQMEENKQKGQQCRCPIK